MKHVCNTFICAALLALSLKAFWIIRIVSTEQCLSLMQNIRQIRCSTRSVILRVMATQQHLLPHWLVQWSRHCSQMCIPVPSPWLPGYTDVMQTVLVILTMAGLFLDILYLNLPIFFPKNHPDLTMILSHGQISLKMIKWWLLLLQAVYVYSCSPEWH